MSTNEDRMFEFIDDTPELPEELFSEVVQTIRRRSRQRRICFALLLSAVLASVLGGSALVIGRTHAAYQEQLQMATDLEELVRFLNGENIEQEYELYALADYSSW